MKLTQEIIDKIQEAMLHTKKDGNINWQDDDEIEVLVEELGGSMNQQTRCNSMGRQSKVLEIEYDVEEKNERV